MGTRHDIDRTCAATMCGNVALRAASIAAIVLLAMVGPTACSRGPISLDDEGFGETFRRSVILTEWYITRPRPPRSAGGADAGASMPAKKATDSLADFTPSAPFLGNRTIVVRSGTQAPATFVSVVLQRQPSCSLSQLSANLPTSLVRSLVGSAVLTNSLPDAGTYLHRLAELTTQPGSANGPCPPSQPGTVGLVAQYLGTTGSGNLLGAVLQNDDVARRIELTPQGRLVSSSAIATTVGRWINAADLNGDGIDDVVAAWGSAAGSSGLMVALSRADGTLATPTIRPYAGSQFNAFVAIDDVNGDGRLDIVAVAGPNTSSATVTVFPGDGTGGFASGPTQAIAGRAAPLIIADFDGDGRKDLLLADGRRLAGLGNGGFAPPAPALPIGAGTAVVSLAAGDFNGDGRADVAALIGPAPGVVQVYLADASGGFAAVATYAPHNDADMLSVTDVNRDGRADIVVGTQSKGHLGPSGNFLQVLFGHGDGSFVGATAVASPQIAFRTRGGSVAIGDLNGDGNADLLLPTARSPAGAPTFSLSLHPGRGDGRFGPPVTVPVGDREPKLVALGDIDGDGTQDIVYVGSSTRNVAGSLGVLRALGRAAFGPERSRSLMQEVSTLAIGDFNGDGRADVALAVFGDGGIADPATAGAFVYFGQADASLSAPLRVDTSLRAGYLAVADLDGDGRSDLIVGDDMVGGGANRGSVRIYLGSADGRFAAPIELTPGSFPQALAAGDIDGDGRIDLVVASDSPAGPALHVYLGSGAGRFAAPRTKALNGRPGSIRALAIADFNRDGKADVAVTADDITRFVLGTGDGSFADDEVGLAIAGSERARELSVARLNADDQPDLVVATTQIGVVALVNRTNEWAAAVVPPGDFRIALGSATATASSGQSVRTTLSVDAGNGLASPISFRCDNLPANSLCTFDPSSVPAGTGTTSVTVDIATGIAATASARLPAVASSGGGTEPARDDRPALLAALAAMSGVVGLRAGPAGRRRGRRAFAWALLLASAIGLVIAGCGGGGGGGTVGGAAITPSGTYPVAITASGGGVTRTSTFTLVVP